MATQKLTEYERRRLENIKRNDEMMASLKIQSKANELSSSTKRERETKSYKIKPEKKSKAETPIVIRRSLRAQGFPPDYSPETGLRDDNSTGLLVRTPDSTIPSKPSARDLGPLSMKDAYCCTASDKVLVDTIIDISRKSEVYPSVGSVLGTDKREGDEIAESLNLGSLVLKPENTARVLPGKITNVQFFPSSFSKVIIVGDKYGNVGFWDMNKYEEGIYLYHPHPAPISGISINQFCLSKVYTSCYDGYIRLMDVEKGVFDLPFYSDHSIYSLSHKPSDLNSLFFGEGYGELVVWDERARKISLSWQLHEQRINSIDFSPENINIMATSSTDGTACIWDLRSISRNKSKALKVIKHKKSVHSAYFSPSGRSLATTSPDNKVGLVGGANFEDISMIYHDNQTSRWISSFRGIWGWDDSYIFIGNNRRGVDVISTAQRNSIMTLESTYMTAIPCRFAAQPCEVGMLAGTTAGGQVYVWSQSH